jgi:hypothetical protein
MPSRFAIALVGLVFLVTLLVRLPAGVVTALLPRNLACIEPSGTLWNGSCGQLQSGTISVSDLHWTLHATSLLSGRPRVDVRSLDPRAAGHASVTLGRNGDADIAALSATLPLQSGLTALLAGWSGQLQLEIAHASISAGHVDSIEGTVRVLNLQLDRPATRIGSFELDFPASGRGAPISGALRDLDGPVSLRGTLQLAGNAYQLDALLAARDPSDPQPGQLLQMLGPPDAEGRHTLSIAGTY